MKRIYLHQSPENLTDELLKFTAKNLEVKEILHNPSYSRNHSFKNLFKVAAIITFVITASIPINLGDSNDKEWKFKEYFPLNKKSEVVLTQVETIKPKTKELIKDKVEISTVVEKNESVQIIASETITLKPGFQVLPGGSFQASIVSSL
ncbi:MAG: hypothetical protein RJA52_292 [Bacteroidota bacterium]|jgi:hypothetical protein